MYVAYDILKQKYPLETVLGKGAYGNVYASKDAVVKVQKISAVGYENFIPELACYQLLSHRGMCKLLAWSLSDVDLYLVIERGVQLPSAYYNDLVSSRQILTDILSCLSFLADHEIVHNDIKPTNIVVREGCIRLIDFGLSTVGIRGEWDTYFQRPVYTKGFFDPQAVGGEYNTIRTDLYALGKTLEYIDEDEFKTIITDCKRFPNTERMTARQLLLKYDLPEVSGSVNYYTPSQQIVPIPKETLELILHTGVEMHLSARTVCLATHNLLLAGIEDIKLPHILASLYIAECLVGIGNVKLSKPMYKDINHLLVLLDGHTLNPSAWELAEDTGQMVSYFWAYCTEPIVSDGDLRGELHVNIHKNITAEQLLNGVVISTPEPPPIREDWLTVMQGRMSNLIECPQSVLYYYPQLKLLSAEDAIKLYQKLLSVAGGRQCLTRMCNFSLTSVPIAYFLKEKLNPFSYTPEME